MALTLVELESIRGKIILALDVAPQPDSGEEGFWIKWSTGRSALWAELQNVEAMIAALEGPAEEETIGLIE